MIALRSSKNINFEQLKLWRFWKLLKLEWIHFALWDNHEPMGSRVLCLGIKWTWEGELGLSTWLVWGAPGPLRRHVFEWSYECVSRVTDGEGEDPPRMWWDCLLGWGLGLNKEREGRKSAGNLAVPTLCFLVSTKDKHSVVPCSQWGNVSVWTANQNKASLALPFCQILSHGNNNNKNTTNPYRF